jgi:quercetin dioxygenase-like cupin family protein
MEAPQQSRDTTVIKVDSSHSPTGPHGERYLASGTSIAMRMWNREPAGERKAPVRRNYETVGYVIEGKAKLHLEGQTVLLERGSSWVVPRGAEHSYEVVETFTAVEATHPPYQVHGRDD